MAATQLNVPPELLQPGQDALLAAKLNAPRLRGTRIERPLLLRELSGNADNSVTLVVAPAGSGKSTLLGQWAARSTAPVAWISLDASENNITTFLAYLAAAIRAVVPSITRLDLDVIRRDSASPQHVVLFLLNELSAAQTPFTLVLDDFHVIDAPAVHEIVLELIDHAPDHMRLVISSRVTPPFPLARLRVSSQVTMIGADDLRFSLNEAAEFLRQMGVELPAEVISDLHARTAGWVAGVKMAALSLSRAVDGAEDFVARFGATTKIVQEFLLEEVLDHQPPSVRTFLLMTALVDRVCPELCHTMTENASAARLLARAVRDQLFISALDDRGEWFQYHDLFLEFLRRRSQLDLSDADRRLASLRAGAWFERHGMLNEAIEIAVSSNDWQRAANLIRPMAAKAIDGEEVRPLATWLRSMPPELLISDAWIAHASTWAEVRTGETAETERIITFAERSGELNHDLLALAGITCARAVRARYQEDGAAAASHVERQAQLLEQYSSELPRSVLAERLGEDRAYHFREFSAIVKVQYSAALRCLGRTHEARGACDDARKTSLAANLPFQAATANVELGCILMQQAHLLEAIECFDAEIRSATIYPSERRLAMLQLAAIHVERGDNADALRLLDESLALARRLGVHTWLPQTHLIRARLAMARDDVEAALAAARDALDAAAGFTCDRLAREAHAFIAGVQLGRGNLSAAAAWARRRRMTPDDPADFAQRHEQLVYARLLIAQGEPPAAVRFLARLFASASADGRTGDVIAILVQLAFGELALLELDRAVSAIDQALRLAEPGGYMRVFTAEGSAMARLLRVAQRRGSLTSYSQHLLAALGDESPAPTRLYFQDLAEPISARELEVLSLIAAGLVNRQIADELYIAPATVKRHVTNLYGKLGVSRRADAIRKARQLGLLRPPEDKRP